MLSRCSNIEVRVRVSASSDWFYTDFFSHYFAEKKEIKKRKTFHGRLLLSNRYNRRGTIVDIFKILHQLCFLEAKFSRLWWLFYNSVLRFSGLAPQFWLDLERDSTWWSFGGIITIVSITVGRLCSGVLSLSYKTAKSSDVWNSDHSSFFQSPTVYSCWRLFKQFWNGWKSVLAQGNMWGTWP